MKSFLSPRQLARAIGVSESTLKRWADEGRLEVARTAGGHRRIPMTEAVRFIRGSGVPLRHPAVLSLPNPAEPGSVPPPSAAPAGEACDRLFDLLVGESPEAGRGYIVSLYLAGWPVTQICDGPIRNALTRIGELWQHGDDGVFVEHRATQACLEALVQLRGLLPPVEADAPVALGGAPAGDPYLIPSRMCGLALASAGYRDIDLGPDTPLPAIAAAIDRHGPAIVWLASSVGAGAAPEMADLNVLVEAAQRAGATVVAGGRGWPRIEAEGIFHGATMAELYAFAAGRRDRRRAMAD